jgi:hypothetical protein
MDNVLILLGYFALTYWVGFVLYYATKNESYDNALKLFLLFTLTYFIINLQ